MGIIVFSDQCKSCKHMKVSHVFRLHNGKGLMVCVLKVPSGEEEDTCKFYERRKSKA